MDLDAVPTSEGPFLASTLKIPHTYCWSAAVIPKPADWLSHIGEISYSIVEPDSVLRHY